MKRIEDLNIIWLFNPKKLFSKSICSLLIGVIICNNGALAGEALKKASQEAELFSKEIAKTIDFMPVQIGESELHFKNQDGSIFSTNIRDFFPESVGKNSFNEQSNIEKIKEGWNSNITITAIGQQGFNELIQDSNSNDPSFLGEAYQFVHEQAKKSSHDVNQSELFSEMQQSFLNMSSIAQNFGDCKPITTFEKTTVKTHAPDYEHCEVQPPFIHQCEVNRTIDLALISSNNPQSLIFSNQTPNVTITLEKAKTTANEKESCQLEEYSINLTNHNNNAIEAVILKNLSTNGHVLVEAINLKTQESFFIWSNNEDEFLEKNVSNCSPNKVWKKDINKDVTSLFKKFNNEEPYKLLVKTKANGEGYGKIVFDLRYSPDKTVLLDQWDISHECQGLINVLSDKFMPGKAICQNNEELHGNFIVKNNLFANITALSKPPFSDIPLNCSSVQIFAEAVKEHNAPCYTDIHGNQQCPTATGYIGNTCEKLNKREECTFVKKSCVEGSQGKSGQCYLEEHTYDCGTTSEVPTTIAKTEYSCSGEIRCMGTECLTAQETNSKDFTKVLALLNTIQTAGQDISCFDKDGNEGNEESNPETLTCEVFKGKPASCKEAVGGIVDCCSKPEGVSLQDYINLVVQVGALSTALNSLSASGVGATSSGVASVIAPITNGFQTIAQPLTTAVESVKGTVIKAIEPIQQIIQSIQDKIASLIQKAFGSIASTTTTATGSAVGSAVGSGAIGTDAIATGAQEVLKQVAEESAKEATKSVLASLSSALSVVTTIYTVYAITMLIIKLIYQCTQSEMELNVQRTLKNTHHVGSYCNSQLFGFLMCLEKQTSYCQFNSPLSRILNEQIKSQFGRDFGTPKEPECGGFHLEELNQVNWEEVNLDEWIGILHETGNLKDATTINLEHLTGSGHSLDLGDRLKADERTIKRLEDVDVAKKRQQAAHLQYERYVGKKQIDINELSPLGDYKPDDIQGFFPDVFEKN